MRNCCSRLFKYLFGREQRIDEEEASALVTKVPINLSVTPSDDFKSLPEISKRNSTVSPVRDFEVTCVLTESDLTVVIIAKKVDYIKRFLTRHQKQTTARLSEPKIQEKLHTFIDHSKDTLSRIQEIYYLYKRDKYDKSIRREQMPILHYNYLYFVKTKNCFSKELLDEKPPKNHNDAFILRNFIEGFEEVINPSPTCTLEREFIENIFAPKLEELNLFVKEEKVLRPTCFISYAWGISLHEDWVRQLNSYLTKAGIETKIDKVHNRTESTPAFINQAGSTDFVLIIGTHNLRIKYERKCSIISSELDIIFKRKGKGVIKIILEGNEGNAFPDIIWPFACDERDFSDDLLSYDEAYFKKIFLLLSNFYPTLHDKITKLSTAGRTKFFIEKDKLDVKGGAGFTKSQIDEGVLQASLPGGASPLLFVEEQVSRDGNCGFTILGATRDELVSTLKSFADDLEARDSLCEEIHEALATGLWEGPSDEGRACIANMQRLDSEFQALFVSTTRKYGADNRVALGDFILFLNTIGCADDAEQLTSANLKIATQREQLIIYCKQRDIFLAYLDRLCINEPPEARLQLGYKSAILYAKAKQIAFYIWTRSVESPNQLRLMDSYIPATPSRQIIHGLHTDRLTHFNLLTEKNNLRLNKFPMCTVVTTKSSVAAMRTLGAPTAAGIFTPSAAATGGGGGAAGAAAAAASTAASLYTAASDSEGVRPH